MRAPRRPPNAHDGVSGDVNVLFVTWDGPRSTYLQGLFLPIFTALRERGFAFHVLQFTWADAAERLALAEACRTSGVSYRSVSILRRPIAAGSLATALWGRVHVRRAIDELGIKLLIPRSTLPALATIPSAGKGARRVRVLLDADGLPHDERVEFGGASPTGLTYRLLRAFEAWSVRRADAVAVRTVRAGQILADRAGPGVDARRFHVVTNARDSRLFKPPAPKSRACRRKELGLNPNQPLLVYAGSSLSGKYRGASMLRFFRHVRALRSDTRLLLLMPQLDVAHELLASHGELVEACLLRTALPERVPEFVGVADLGLAVIHATFSMQAVAAVKVGEYLLCGVPVLASRGVGDTDSIIGPDVGHCLENTDDSSLQAAAVWFVNTVLPDRDGFRARCREVGVSNFAIETGVRHYDEALCSALSANASRWRSRYDSLTARF